MACEQSKSNACITQTLNKHSSIIGTLFGRIRNHWDSQSSKYKLIFSAGCVTNVLLYFDKIGLILDGSEIIQKFIFAVSTFDGSLMADWAKSNLLILMIVVFLLWMVRPMLWPPTRWLVTVICKCKRQARYGMTARKVQRKADLSMASEQPQTALPKQAVPPRQTNPRYLYGGVGGQSRFRLYPQPSEKEGHTPRGAPQPEMPLRGIQAHFPGLPHPAVATVEKIRKPKIK